MTYYEILSALIITNSMKRAADCRGESDVAINFWNFTLMPAKKSLLLVVIVQSLPLEYRALTLHATWNESVTKNTITILIQIAK